MRLKKCFLLLIYLFAIKTITAQTCTGSLGDAIVNITFGAGANYGAALPVATTSGFQYRQSPCPPDGTYSILNYTSGCWPNDVVWHSATDHTGNSNGYYMLVNATSAPSDFYIQTINGLCEGTSYQFAAWLLNMCSVRGISPNITFTIERTDGTILETYNTQDIPIINPVTWKQYGFYFTTPVGVSDVVLRMRNNAPGGVGNDLGLDDITFRPAGPAIKASITASKRDTIDICADNTSSFQLQATVENCYTASAYQWQISTDNGNTWSNIADANNDSYTRTQTPAGTFLYRLTVSETINLGITNCRVASNPITINVNALPVTTATNDGPACAGSTITLNATGGKGYNWTGANGFLANTSQPSITNTTIDNAGKYYVTVSSNQGCVSTDSTTVVLYSLPVADFTVKGSICEKNVVSFIDNTLSTGLPVTKWSWNFGDGTTGDGDKPTHIFAVTNNYKVSLQAQNDKDCKSTTVIKDIMVNPLPQPNFLLPAICLTDPFATFVNNSFISDNSGNQLLYNWNFGDINATLNNPNTSAQASPKHSYTSVGVYAVNLAVTSKDGCIKDSTQNFTVNGTKPTAKFNIDAATDFCSNKPIIISNASSVDFGSISKLEIYWDDINAPLEKITDSFPPSGKNYNYSYENFGNPLTKEFQLRYVVYSGISCANEIKVPVTIKASPQIQFNTFDKICAGDKPFMFTQASEINFLNGIGTYTGDGINAIGLFNPAAANEGKHIIRYTFLAANNCTAFAEQPIVIFNQPKVNAGTDRVMVTGGSVTLNATAVGNGLQYKWLPNTNIESNSVLQPKVSPVTDITYTIQATSADGCVTKDSVLVTVLKGIYIPSAFSPNGDGLNDSWYIPFLSAYEGAVLEVFNRYGQQVFYSKEKTVDWDGRFKGTLLLTGSYAWVLKFGNGKKTIAGMVTIIR